MIEKLKKLLEEKKVKYEAIKHEEAFTAQEIAATTHTPGKEMVKVVILNGDEKFFMAVLPASYRIDIEKLKGIVNVKNLRLSTEEEFERLFPDCEVGAMPPFGNLYNIGVYVDKVLSEDETIVFLVGNHKESIKMKYKDFTKLVKPNVEEFAVKLH
jgi:Ala-tRNA(Pro) deacylase